jgi:Leucine-rich repeat (LRR) protein
VNAQSKKTKGSFKCASPEEAYKAAKRRIVNNALRREQSSLDLSNFGLTELPIEIGQLNLLQDLNISNNQLVNFPPEFGGMSALRTVNASVNILVMQLSEMLSLQ